MSSGCQGTLCQHGCLYLLHCFLDEQCVWVLVSFCRICKLIPAEEIFGLHKYRNTIVENTFQNSKLTDFDSKGLDCASFSSHWEHFCLPVTCSTLLLEKERVLLFTLELDKYPIRF